MIELSSRR